MLQWERGRQLKEFGGITFTYDAGGVRQSKTANGVTTSYFTEGSRIHREERSDGKTLLYAYDASGLASITYNGTLYFVQKNFQGDIVALVNQNGNVVAKYVYDAWGNGKVCNASGTENTSSSFIGNINPFRYRGYYYDVETGLYYLQTRYYEPRAGRFLNADSVDYIAPDIIGGLNLYAYCNNNPVMYSDPEGTAAWWEWAGLIAVSIIAIGAIVAGTILTGGAAAISTAGLIGSTLTGAGIGFLGGATASVVVQGAATSWDFEKINPVSALQSGLIGAAIGGIGGVTSYGFGCLGQTIGSSVGQYLSGISVKNLTVGNAFKYLGGSNMIQSLFSKIGKGIGAIIGGYVTNDNMNQLFSKNSSPLANLADSIQGEIESAALESISKLFKWLL